jgi:hypothetical protein
VFGPFTLALHPILGVSLAVADENGPIIVE